MNLYEKSKVQFFSNVIYFCSLQAPDGIKKASSLDDEIKSEFWESQEFITVTVSYNCGCQVV